MKFPQLTKPRLIGLLSLAGVAPWFSGGKEPVGLLISLFALVLALFFIWRAEDTLDLGGAAPVMLLALVTWSGLSLFWSVNRLDSVLSVAGLYILVGGFVIGRWLRQTGRWQSWLQAYLWLAAGFSLVGIYLLLAGSYERLTATFYWANPMASFLLPALFLSYWWWGNSGNRRFGLAAVVIGTAFLLTYSRGGMLAGLVIGLPALVLLRHKSGFWRRFMFAALLAVGLSTLIPQLRGLTQKAAAPPPAQQSRFAEAVSGESVSVQDRVNYLESSLIMWQQRPLLGWGGGTWAAVYPGYQERVISASSSPHNWYMQALVELGVIGFGLLIAAVAAVLWSGLRQTATQPMAPVTLGLAALALHLGMDIGAGYPVLMLLAGALFGIVYLTKPGGRWVLPVTLLAGFVLAWPLASYYQSHSLRERAEVWQDNHDFTKAAEVFAQASSGLVYDPDNLTAQGINYHALAAQGIARASNSARSQELSNQAIALDRLDSQHYFLRARSKVLAEKYDEAEVDYRLALERDSLNHPDYYIDLARLLMFRQRWQDAASVLDKVIGLYPDSVLANRALDQTVAPLVETAKSLRSQVSDAVPGA